MNELTLRLLQENSCLSPIQTLDTLWVEVSYSSPYSLECLQSGRKSPSGSRTYDFLEPNCGGTFVFVGDITSMASSVQLTAYQPRRAYFSPYLPYVLERMSMCIFHVSLTLALLNSLPVSSFKASTVYIDFFIYKAYYFIGLQLGLWM